jgi:hypothetical protein
MPWKRCGLIYSSGRQPNCEWAASHAQCPTLDRVSDRTLRIYFGTRDTANRTRPTFIEVDPNHPERVTYVHDRPVLDLGELGAFDDVGVTPFCVVNVDTTKYLYYAGCNTSTSVPYRMSIGLAVSEDGGYSFHRCRRGPILDRTPDEPHFCSAPFVIREGREWRMWYLSCLGWRLIGDRPEPQYHVKVARSDDGLRWCQDGSVAIALAHANEAITRPWVLRTANRWQMWYCHRSLDGYRTDKEGSYRIGYADSDDDGANWVRRDESAGLGVSAEGWDCEMTAYPAVYQQAGRLYLLYNGNGFGRSGFGYAVGEESTNDTGSFAECEPRGLRH